MRCAGRRIGGGGLRGIRIKIVADKASSSPGYGATKILVRKDLVESGRYREPKDLKGKRIGVPEYQITAVVWMRGIMQHEYDVLPTGIHWRSGGQ